MTDTVLTKFIIAILIIVVAGLAGWLIQVAFPWIFQNATGGYSNESTATVVNNLPLLFMGLGVLIVVIYLLLAVTHAAKK